MWVFADVDVRVLEFEYSASLVEGSASDENNVLESMDQKSADTDVINAHGHRRMQSQSGFA